MSRLMGIAAALAASLGIGAGLAAAASERPHAPVRAIAVQPAMIGADEPVYLGRVLVTATALPDSSDWT